MENKSRIALIKGYVAVIGNQDLHYWFPSVAFYDNQGSLIIVASQDTVNELYRALLYLSGNESKGDGTIISNLTGSYYLSWYKGCISLFMSGDNNQLVTINKHSADPLISLIENV